MTMKRDVLILCIVYCLAVCAAVLLPQLDTGIVFVFLALVLGLRLLCFRGRRLFAFLLVLCVGLGFARTSYTNNAANYMPEEFESLTVYVKGVMQEIKRGDGYCYYIVAPEEISIDTVQGTPLYGQAKAKLAVTVYEKDHVQQPYAYGDRVVIRGAFTLPETPDNEGAFDFGLWNKTDGVYGSVICDESCVWFVDKAKTNPILSAAYFVRTYVTDTVRNYIGGDAGALLSGILVSDRSEISENLTASIAKAGLSHICAASGMHVAVLYGILLWIFTHLRVRRRIYYPICAVVLIFFAMIAGGGASIVRAVLMFDFCVLSFMTRGDEDRLYTCLCSGFVMLLYKPLYLFSVGFLLSFACVFGILLFSGRVEAFLHRFLRWHFLSSAVAVSLCAQIFTLPIVAIYFHSLSVYSVLYNVMLVWLIAPLMAFAMVFLLVSSVWSIGALGLGFVLKLLLQGMCAVISTVEYLPFSSVSVETPGFFGCLFYYAVVLGVCAHALKKKDYMRICKRVACICMLALSVSALIGNFYVKLHFINVGEGDCALLRMPGGVTVLLDGGGSSGYRGRNVGKDTVLPYLQYKGVNEIDYAIVSHYDADHAQGILYICENAYVKNLVLPQRHPMYSSTYKTLLEQCAAARGIRVHYMQAGDTMTLPGGLRLDALSPDAQMLDYKLPENELSLVLRVSYGDMKMLFTGDIEKIAEQRLCLSDTDLRAQLLKVAHHGSETSSTDRFIERVMPQYALISAGNYTVNAHPALRTYIVLTRAGAEVHNTATAGDVTFYLQKSGVKWIK